MQANIEGILQFPLKTLSLFSLVRFSFPLICRILVLLPKATKRVVY